MQFPELPNKSVAGPLRGVGGWLLFYIIIGIVVPIRAVFRLKNIYEAEVRFGVLSGAPGWASIKIFAWLLSIVCVSLYVLSVFLLWNFHRPRSVSFAIIVTWVVGPLSVAAHYLFMSWIFGSRSIGQDVFGGAGVAIIYATLWTAYFKFSVRIKNTYQTPDAVLQKKLST